MAASKRQSFPTEAETNPTHEDQQQQQQQFAKVARQLSPASSPSRASPHSRANNAPVSRANAPSARANAPTARAFAIYETEADDDFRFIPTKPKINLDAFHQPLYQMAPAKNVSPPSRLSFPWNSPKARSSIASPVTEMDAGAGNDADRDGAAAILGAGRNAGGAHPFVSQKQTQKFYDYFFPGSKRMSYAEPSVGGPSLPTRPRPLSMAAVDDLLQLGAIPPDLQPHQSQPPPPPPHRQYPPSERHLPSPRNGTPYHRATPNGHARDIGGGNAAPPPQPGTPAPPHRGAAASSGANSPRRVTPNGLQAQQQQTQPQREYGYNNNNNNQNQRQFHQNYSSSQSQQQQQQQQQQQNCYMQNNYQNLPSPLSPSLSSPTSEAPAHHHLGTSQSRGSSSGDAHDSARSSMHSGCTSTGGSSRSASRQSPKPPPDIADILETVGGYAAPPPPEQLYSIGEGDRSYGESNLDTSDFSSMRIYETGSDKMASPVRSPMTSAAPTSTSGAGMSRIGAGNDRAASESRGESDSVYQQELTYADKYNKLPELTSVPWSDRDVLNVLCEGRAKDVAANLPIDVVHRLSYLLQRPLVRLARELQRLASHFRRLTRHDVTSGLRVILSASLFASATRACVKALTLAKLEGASVKKAKSTLAGLQFPVGRFHRWLLDARVAPRVSVDAAIFVAAAAENLLEDVVILAVGRRSGSGRGGEREPLTMETLEMGIANTPDVWGLLQPWEHLVCGRNATGNLTLPNGSVESLQSLFLEVAARERQESFCEVNKRTSVVEPPQPPQQQQKQLQQQLPQQPPPPPPPQQQQQKMSKAEEKMSKQKEKELRKSQRKNKGKKPEISSPLQQTDTVRAAISALSSPQSRSSVAASTSGFEVGVATTTSASSGGERSSNAGSLTSDHVEQGLLATCIGSVEELKELVYVAMHFDRAHTLSGHNPHNPHNPTHTPSSSCHDIYASPSAIYATPRVSASAASSSSSSTPVWSKSALNCLFYFMKCSQLEHVAPEEAENHVHINYDRPYIVLPPLFAWVRVSASHARHRNARSVDADDVRQAARVLLPDSDCPPRPLTATSSVDESEGASEVDAATLTQRFQTEMAFRMLTSGRLDLLTSAATLLGPNGLNAVNETGMTPLMVAAVAGEADMAAALIEAGARFDSRVPSTSNILPCIRGWTALHFATAFDHLHVVQLLLDRGVDVEGFPSATPSSAFDLIAQLVGDSGADSRPAETTPRVETPLLLAAAAGNKDTVAALMAKGADPFLALDSDASPSSSSSSSSDLMPILGTNAISAAAAHGRRDILHFLVHNAKKEGKKKKSANDFLSLEEMLAEGLSESPPKEEAAPPVVATPSSSKHKAYEPMSFHRHKHLDYSQSIREGRNSSQAFDRSSTPTKWTTFGFNNTPNSTPNTSKYIQEALKENKSMHTVMTFEEILQEGVDDSRGGSPKTSVDASHAPYDSYAPPTTSTPYGQRPPSSTSSSSSAPYGPRTASTPHGHPDPQGAKHSLYETLKKAQRRVLTEAMYHAAENGHVDITVDLRNMGVPWSLHSWTSTLSSAYERRRRSVIQILLSDFVVDGGLSVFKSDDFSNPEFAQDSLPLLFDIFRQSKNNEPLTRKLAAIFKRCFGDEPIEEIPVGGYTPPAKIDIEYVNNPDMSDLQFLVEGRVFFAHRIILVNASARFKSLLTSVAGVRNSVAMDSSAPGLDDPIDIEDVRYGIFELIMLWLYSGGDAEMRVEENELVELMSAAHAFGLEGLQRHCEIALSRHLRLDNVVDVFKTAKLYSADALVRYCLGFMLRHLPTLAAPDADAEAASPCAASFRRLAFSSRAQSQDALNGLLRTLTERMLRRRGGGGGGDDDYANNNVGTVTSATGRLDRTTSGSVLSVVTSGGGGGVGGMGAGGGGGVTRPGVPLRSTPV